MSAASAWEVAAKARIGKLPEAVDLAQEFAHTLKQQRLQPLPISAEHAQRAGLLPGPHKDPFDRMLIAQAQAENLLLVSNEEGFDAYGVSAFMGLSPRLAGVDSTETGRLMGRPVSVLRYASISRGIASATAPVSR